MTSAPAHIAARFAEPGRKRILSLDGGGARGIISLCFLEQIEATLRALLGQPKLVLADYFDLIGGTSVGAMIATLLAAGKDVAYIRNLFKSWVPRIFNPDSWGVVDHMYDARVLRGLVQTEVFDWPLGTEHLKTGLCIIVKRADTGSVWPVTNNPCDPYYNARKGRDGAPDRLGNGDYKLLDLIRAATAAPRYFSPKEIGIFTGVDSYGSVDKGVFIDGAVSPHNNPALQLFMMAGISGYNLGGGPLEPRGERRAWKLGADNLLLISVGTGSYDHSPGRTGFAAVDAAQVLQGMISDGQQLALTLLQWMSMPNRSWPIDRVIGDLSHDLLGDGAGLAQPLLAFQRYDIVLESDWLSSRNLITSPIAPDELERLRDFTNPGSLLDLEAIASRAAKAQVKPEDFPVDSN